MPENNGHLKLHCLDYGVKLIEIHFDDVVCSKRKETLHHIPPSDLSASYLHMLLNSIKKTVFQLHLNWMNSFKSIFLSRLFFFWYLTKNLQMVQFQSRIFHPFLMYIPGEWKKPRNHWMGSYISRTREILHK